MKHTTLEWWQWCEDAISSLTKLERWKHSQGDSGSDDSNNDFVRNIHILHTLWDASLTFLKGGAHFNCGGLPGPREERQMGSSCEMLVTCLRPLLILHSVRQSASLNTRTAGFHRNCSPCPLYVWTVLTDGLHSLEVVHELPESMYRIDDLHCFTCSTNKDQIRYIYEQITSSYCHENQRWSNPCKK